nr:nucleotidyltransferase domain-containing protein [uncultured Aminipila sp.]
MRGETVEEIYQEISNLGRKYGAEKIVLFGSRARKDNRVNSDIDIAVFSMPEQKRTFLGDDIDNLPTLLKFNTVHISEGTDTKLLNNIADIDIFKRIKEQYVNLFDEIIERLR